MKKIILLMLSLFFAELHAQSVDNQNTNAASFFSGDVTLGAQGRTVKGQLIIETDKKTAENAPVVKSISLNANNESATYRPETYPKSEFVHQFKKTTESKYFVFLDEMAVVYKRIGNSNEIICVVADDPKIAKMYKNTEKALPLLNEYLDAVKAYHIKLEEDKRKAEIEKKELQERLKKEALATLNTILKEGVAAAKLFKEKLSVVQEIEKKGNAGVIKAMFKPADTDYKPTYNVEALLGKSEIMKGAARTTPEIDVDPVSGEIKVYFDFYYKFSAEGKLLEVKIWEDDLSTNDLTLAEKYHNLYLKRLYGGLIKLDAKKSVADLFEETNGKAFNAIKPGAIILFRPDGPKFAIVYCSTDAFVLKIFSKSTYSTFYTFFESETILGPRYYDNQIGGIVSIGEGLVPYKRDYNTNTINASSFLGFTPDAQKKLGGEDKKQEVSNRVDAYLNQALNGKYLVQATIFVEQYGKYFSNYDNISKANYNLIAKHILEVKSRLLQKEGEKLALSPNSIGGKNIVSIEVVPDKTPSIHHEEKIYLRIIAKNQQGNTYISHHKDGNIPFNEYSIYSSDGYFNSINGAFEVKLSAKLEEKGKLEIKITPELYPNLAITKEFVLSYSAEVPLGLFNGASGTKGENGYNGKGAYSGGISGGEDGKPGGTGENGEWGEDGKDVLLRIGIGQHPITKKKLVKYEVKLGAQRRYWGYLDPAGQGAAISARGGNGGNGGNGGLGGKSHGYHKAGPCGDGGNAGKGGDGGDVTIIIDPEAVAYKNLFKIRNEGGKAGQPGKKGAFNDTNKYNGSDGIPSTDGRNGKIEWTTSKVVFDW